MHDNDCTFWEGGAGRAPGMRDTRLKLVLGTYSREKAEESGIQPQGSLYPLILTPPSRSQDVPQGRSRSPRLTLLANGSSASAPCGRKPVPRNTWPGTRSALHIDLLAKLHLSAFIFLAEHC
jgi:hypothetical protein